MVGVESADRALARITSRSKNLMLVLKHSQNLFKCPVLGSTAGVQGLKKNLFGINKIIVHIVPSTSNFNICLFGESVFAQSKLQWADN